MKYVLIFGVVLQMFLYIYKNQQEYEPFYIFKCMLYLFISTIHSIIITFKLPLGACLMYIIYLLDKKNHSVKSRLIISGLIIAILSAITYKDISIPFQKLYLYNIKSDITKIEVYTHNGSTNKYLFSIDNKMDIAKWYNVLRTSTPYSSWNYKVIPRNSGYLIKLHSSSKMLPIILTPSTPNLPNVFIGGNFISYTNKILPNLTDSYCTIKPVSLKIFSTDTEITDSNIISDLWDEILWNEQLNHSSAISNTFSINSRLILNLGHQVNLSFSSNFKYLKLNDTHILELSEYLSNKLNEQYILSDLDPINELTNYPPAHVHTTPQNTVNYSIEIDSSGRYYGLYSHADIENPKIFLHNVSSSTSKFFVLKSPYLLLLDEKYPNKYYLMLINQNLPDKHRYIEKNKNIIPRSIALCPNNTKFTYTINDNSSSTLYLVNNYYDPPLIIAHGTILDSLFLSNQYIIFSLVIDDSNLLCIYDTSLSKTVRYITIPGNLYLVKVENGNIIFSIQNQKNNNLKEGIFSLDTAFNIKKID